MYYKNIKAKRKLKEKFFFIIFMNRFLKITHGFQTFERNKEMIKNKG